MNLSARGRACDALSRENSRNPEQASEQTGKKRRPTCEVRLPGLKQEIPDAANAPDLIGAAEATGDEGDSLRCERRFLNGRNSNFRAICIAAFPPPSSR